ncbi:hypothetical protein NVIRENTERO_02073 [Sodalis praecaptivus]|nr:hypothetical protein NVIRENTERO_02073 [Sodalis praecaptivus]
MNSIWTLPIMLSPYGRYPRMPKPPPTFIVMLIPIKACRGWGSGGTCFLWHNGAIIKNVK